MKIIKILALINLAVFCLSSNASDLALSYRNIFIGDSFNQVLSKVKNEFDMYAVESPDEIFKISGNFKNVANSINAGNQEGMKPISVCPISAPNQRRTNCLKAGFYTRFLNNKDSLLYINVTQSFNPAIKLDGFLKKLEVAYGNKHTEYVSKSTNSDTGIITEKTLLWGGRNTPETYTPSFVSNDFEVVGGKFIISTLYITNGEVLGYELKIADAEAMKQSNHERTKELKELVNEQKSKNLQELKF